jgi:hypothetical protein
MMTNEQILALAEQAGFKRTYPCCGIKSKTCQGDVWEGNIQGFVAAIRAAALEEAAQWHDFKAEANALEGREIRVSFHKSSAVQLRELAKSDGSSKENP